MADDDEANGGETASEGGEGQMTEELRLLLEVWDAEQEEEDWDPDAMLERCCEMLESATNDFLLHNPDPLDDRHPSKSEPACELGKLLRVLTSNDAFINRLIISYLLGGAARHDDSVPKRCLLAARLLINLLPGLESNAILTEAESLMEKLFIWAETSTSRELRAYSMSLLGGAMDAEQAHQYRNNNAKLIPIALHNLRDLHARMMAEDAERDMAAAAAHRASQRKGSRLGPTNFAAALAASTSRNGGGGGKGDETTTPLSSIHRPPSHLQPPSTPTANGTTTAAAAAAGANTPLYSLPVPTSRLRVPSVSAGSSSTPGVKQPSVGRPQQRTRRSSAGEQDVGGAAADKNTSKVNNFHNNSSSKNVEEQQQEGSSSLRKRRRSGGVGAAMASSEDHSTTPIHPPKRARVQIGGVDGVEMEELVMEEEGAGHSNASSSTWRETVLPLVVGRQPYRLEPLSLEMEQRLLLDYLTPTSEFSDNLSIVLESRALDTINNYLAVGGCRDARLLFEVLRFISSLLMHRKFAWEFLLAGATSTSATATTSTTSNGASNSSGQSGVEQLLLVNRLSIASTGVATCLYYLAYSRDIMEKVCHQLSDAMLDALVDYALWLLDYSYESGRSAAAMFFVYALRFRPILQRFDHRDGLRRAFNYISTLTLLQPPKNPLVGGRRKRRRSNRLRPRRWQIAGGGGENSDGNEEIVNANNNAAAGERAENTGGGGGESDSDEEEDEDDDEDEEEISDDQLQQSLVTVKNAVQLFRSYLSARLYLKMEHLAKQLWRQHGGGGAATATSMMDGRGGGGIAFPSACLQAVMRGGGGTHKTQIISLEPDAERDCIDYLIASQHFFLPHHQSWAPVEHLRQLDLLPRTLVLLVAKCTDLHHYGYSSSHGGTRVEVLRLAVELLHVATVSPRVQLDLCETMVIRGTPVQGLGLLLELAEGDVVKDAAVMRAALGVLNNCLGGPAPPEPSSGSARQLSPSNAHPFAIHYRPFNTPHGAALSKTPTQTPGKPAMMGPPPLMRSYTPQQCLRTAWACAQQNSAIMVLTRLLHVKEPPTDADAIRELACRVLNSLARYEPVRQILSKLALIAASEINVLMQEPVMLGRRQEHTRFCHQAIQLIERVMQTKILHDPIPKDLTIEKILKTAVVAQTRIVYNQTELLQLIYQHLADSGLRATASQLQQEAQLPSLPASRLPSTTTTLPVFPRLYQGSFSSRIKSPPSLPPLSRAASRMSIEGGEAAPVATTSDSSAAATLAGTAHRQCSSSSAAVAGTSAAMLVASTPTIAGTPRRFLPFVRHQPSSAGHHSSGVGPVLEALTSGSVGAGGTPSAFSNSESQQPAFTLQVRPHQSLNEIATEHFRKQHASCRNPLATCPPFSIFYPHHCPEQRLGYSAPTNVVARMLARSQISHRCTMEMMRQADRQLVFSRFRYLRNFQEDNETLTCCAFSPDDQHLLLGTYAGDLLVYSHRDHQLTSPIHSAPCHSSSLTSIRQRGKLLLTSSAFVSPYSAMWRVNSPDSSSYSLTQLRAFDEDYLLDFANLQPTSQLVGTRGPEAHVYDLESGARIATLYDEALANHYVKNRACFNPSDDLVLNDGVLWDLRSWRAGAVHKFDKLNADLSGVFHPKAAEVIVNSEVWDLRTYRLLHTVSALNQCRVEFNSTGDILFGVVHSPTDSTDDRFLQTYAPSFRTFDASNYQVITTVDTRRALLDFCCDHSDRNVAVVEVVQRGSGITDDDFNLCKLYDIGRRKEADEEEDEDEEEEEEQDGNDDGDDEEEDDMDSENAWALSSSSSNLSGSSLSDDTDDDEDLFHQFRRNNSAEPGEEDAQQQLDSGNEAANEADDAEAGSGNGDQEGENEDEGEDDDDDDADDEDGSTSDTTYSDEEDESGSGDDVGSDGYESSSSSDDE